MLLRGDLDGAEAQLRDALQRRQRVLGAAHLATAATSVNLARVLLVTGRLAEAEVLLHDALSSVGKQVPAGDDWQTGWTQGVLGACLSAQGRYGEAEQLLLAGYATLKATKGPAARLTRETLVALVKHFHDRGNQAKVDEFTALLNEARRQFNRRYGSH